MARRRLRRVATVFFLALGVPLALLFVWTYRQLQNESFLALRMEAESFIGQLEDRVRLLLEPEEKRSFDEYSFFSVTESSLVQEKGIRYSPLSELPPRIGLPGLIGYYQVNPDQSFQTPLLPAINQQYVRKDVLGLSEAELEKRQQLQNQLADIVQLDAAVKKRSAKEEKQDHNLALLSGAQAPAAPGRRLEEIALDEGYLRRNTAKHDSRSADTAYSSRDSSSPYRTSRKAKVSVAEQNFNGSSGHRSNFDDLKEQALESPANGREPAAALPGVSLGANERLANDKSTEFSSLAKRIVTFEGEFDPFQLRISEENRLLFFRRVWRDKVRYIQGFVIDGAPFIETLVNEALARSSIAYSGIIRVSFGGNVVLTQGSVPAGKESLVVRRFLAAPLNEIEVVVSTGRLPLSPAAPLILTLSAVITMVLCVGVLLLYRMSLREIELSEQKGDFVSAVSHELKTPLTSIRMYAEMLKSGWVRDKAKEQSYYEFIFSESERLSRLIANVLQLAGLSRDNAPFEMKELSPQTILRLIEEKTRTQLEQAGFLLRIEAPELPPSVVIRAEEDALSRIFINLIDNAVKFSRTAERREVVYSVQLDHPQQPRIITFSVRDFGPGIPSGQHDQIFQLFYRAESELTRATPGTGIGLALVKELAQRMGARVDVVNARPGAEFRITFAAKIASSTNSTK